MYVSVGTVPQKSSHITDVIRFTITGSGVLNNEIIYDKKKYTDTKALYEINICYHKFDRLGFWVGPVAH